jgi:hypothetical protein
MCAALPVARYINKSILFLYISMDSPITSLTNLNPEWLVYLASKPFNAMQRGAALLSLITLCVANIVQINIPICGYANNTKSFGPVDFCYNMYLDDNVVVMFEAVLDIDATRYFNDYCSRDLIYNEELMFLEYPDYAFYIAMFYNVPYRQVIKTLPLIAYQMLDDVLFCEYFKKFPTYDDFLAYVTYDRQYDCAPLNSTPNMPRIIAHIFSIKGIQFKDVIGKYAA